MTRSHLFATVLFTVLPLSSTPAQVPFATGVRTAAANIDAPPAVLSALGIRRGRVQTIDALPRIREPFELTVELGGQQMRLALAPFDLRSHDFAVTLDDGMSQTPFDAPGSAQWRGTVVGVVDSAVAASIDGDGLHAMVILDRQRTFGIEPLASTTVTGFGPRAHAVFASADILRSGHRCGTQTAVPTRSVGTAMAAAAGSSGRVLEMAVDADYSYYVSFGRSPNNVILTVEYILNATGLIYGRDVDVDILLSELVIRNGRVYTPTSDYEQYLIEFRDRWNLHHTGVRRDVAQLFSSLPVFAGGILGGAYLGTVCAPTQSHLRYGINILTSPAPIANVGLLCHELGHNCGSLHCTGGAGSDCRIMCPGIGGCSTDLTRFGASSIAQIQSHFATFPCLPRRAGDDCGTATMVQAGGNGPFSDRLSSLSVLSFASCTPRNRDSWFRYVTAQPGETEIRVRPSTPGYVSSVSVFEGADCASLSWIGCATDAGTVGGGAGASVVVPERPVGTVLSIRVGDLDPGDFIVDVTCCRASSSAFGVGCVLATPAYYDQPRQLSNLAQRSIEMTPNAAGGYDVAVGGPAWRSQSSSPYLTAPTFGVQLTLPFTFNYPGGSTNDITISPDGSIALGAVAQSPSASVAELLDGAPRLAPAWANWFTLVDRVFYEVLATEVYVTWAMDWFGDGRNQSFQCVLRADGTVSYRYDPQMSLVQRSDCIVGASPGGGQPDPGPSDLLIATTLTTRATIEPSLLEAEARPRTGTSVPLRTTLDPAVSASAAVVAIGILPIPTGLDLQLIGMPDCSLYTSVEITLPAAVQGGSTLAMLRLPSVPSAWGLSLYAQGLVVAPGSNALGVITTNGVELRINQN